MRGSPGTATAELRRRAPATSIAEAVSRLPDDSTAILLHAVALEARALTQADLVVIGLGLNAEGWERSVCVGPRNAGDGLGEWLRHVRELPAASQTLHARETENDPKVRALFAREPELKRSIAIPLHVGGVSVGHLCLALKQSGGDFSEQDERVAGMLAARSNLALASALPYGDGAAALAPEGEWLSGVFDAWSEAIVVVDTHGNTVCQNLAARALSATLTASEQGGGPFGALRYRSGARIPPADSPLERALRRRATTVGLECFVPAPGIPRPVLQSAAPIEVDQRLFGAVAVLQELGPVEDSVCEQRVLVLGHDLRQPLNVITLAIGMALRGDSSGLSGDQRRALERIASAAAKLDRMIDRLIYR